MADDRLELFRRREKKFVEQGHYLYASLLFVNMALGEDPCRLPSEEEVAMMLKELHIDTEKPSLYPVTASKIREALNVLLAEEASEPKD